MLDPENQALKDLLLAEGICTEYQIGEFEEEHSRSGKSLFDIVIGYRIITESELLKVIALSMGSEVVDLSSVEPSKAVLDMVDIQTARMYEVVPLSFDGATLIIATSNPLNYQVRDELQFFLNKEVFIVVASETHVAAALKRYYPEEPVSKGPQGLDIAAERSSLQPDAAATDAPVIRFVDLVLYQAIKERASDIHFEPFEKEFKIRYRVDGALYEIDSPPMNLVSPVISRLKIMSGLNISETRLPQDGRIQLKIGGKPVDLRVSTLPTAFGESVVLRILDRSVVNLNLDSLGFAHDTLVQIKDMINRPNGIFIVTGPTGSGKSTSLYSCLQEVNKVGDKLLTAEDPVEYDIDGILQVPINEAIGMTFAKALRAFLRQDPDRIMLGEIRDVETATMSIEASLTGHFVYSTLHTNDAAGAITRLIDMGIEPFLIASSLVGILGQRLIRRICPICKTAFTPDLQDLSKLNLTSGEVVGKQFFYGKGCDKCNHTGYKGRKVISELLTLGPEIKELILEKAPTVVIREKARELGMYTMREDGIRAILSGETTLEEIVKYT